MYYLTKATDPDGIRLDMLLPDNATSRGKAEYACYWFNKEDAIKLAQEICDVVTE